MDSSEDQSLNNDNTQEFYIHKPTARQPKKHLPNIYKANQIMQLCWKKHKQILKRNLQQFSQQIVEQINCNFKGLITLKQVTEQVKGDSKNNESKTNKQPKRQKKQKPKKQTITQGQMNQEQQRKYRFSKQEKLIIPICLRKSQQEYIQIFFNYLSKRLSKFKKKQQQQNQQPQQSQNKQQRKKEKKKKTYNVFQSANYINFFVPPNEKDNKDLISRQQRSIVNIALYLHNKMNQISTKQDMTIYLSPVVTNLSPQNIYILEQGLAQFNCVLILPTFHSFDDALYSKIAKNQIIPFKLFEHKHLFSQLMYQCICDPFIMGYLPKQSLKLIDDFQDFPITYVEGTKRLIYCLQRLQVLRQRRKIKFNHFDIKNLLQIIQKAILKTFIFFHNKYKTIKKYVKCILDEKQFFNILDKYLNKVDYYKREQQKCKTQIQLVTDLRERLIRYIERVDSIKQLSVYLKQDHQQKNTKIKKKKDKQLIRYGVNPDHGMDQKNLLQKQIRLCITHLTNQIRKQANNFSWSQFHYIERIKPMFPSDIFAATGRLSPRHYSLIEFIYSQINTPLVRVISAFCHQSDMEYGQLMYYLKDLELYGFIDISQSSLNPIITPGFFSKATYYNRRLA